MVNPSEIIKIIGKNITSAPLIGNYINTWTALKNSIKFNTKKQNFNSKNIETKIKNSMKSKQKA